MALAATGQEITAATMIALAELRKSHSALIRDIDSSELESVVQDAVVRAEATYNDERGYSRFNWLVVKGMWLAREWLRTEHKHRLGLTETELRRRAPARPVVPLDVVLPSVHRIHSTAPPPEAVAHSRLLRERLEKALDALPDQRAAAAFRLTVWHDWSQDDVGEMFSVTGSMVSKWLLNARAELQEAFADLAPDQRAA